MMILEEDLFDDIRRWYALYMLKLDKKTLDTYSSDAGYCNNMY